MNDNKSKQRKIIRLPEFDYSENGVYFITICTKDKQKLFWTDANEKMPIENIEIRDYQLSEYGRIADEGINNISKFYPMITVEKYVIMPNHIHLLLLICSDDLKCPTGVPKISTVINQFKGFVTRRIGKLIWQSRFYDHIIRDENDFMIKWNYIDTNPIRWELDDYY